MQKKTEIRLRTIARQESQFRMNEFLSIMSHDIKTPLTSIKGNLQLVGRRLKNNQHPDQSAETKKVLADARDLLERTDIQVNRLTQLVNNLLESSRIYSNTMDLLFELSELNGILQEVLQDARYIPRERTIHIEIPTEKSVLVMADPNRIKQVVIHYLSNAHKYSKTEHAIGVSLHEDGLVARVQVRDEGPGIPVSEQKRIWERFYRIPDTQTLNGSEVGLGLGLHICSTVIEQHRGKVGVHSTPGNGSTFWFTLPLAESSLH